MSIIIFDDDVLAIFVNNNNINLLKWSDSLESKKYRKKCDYYDEEKRKKNY